MATTSCWFLAFVWAVWWLPLMLAVPEEQQGDGCSAKRCGNLTVSDPFWLPDWEAGRSCGPLDFEVGCFHDNIPFLRSSGFDGYSGFSIMNISYEERNLRVVDLHKKSDFNVPNACNFPRLNTSSKLALPFKVNNSNPNLIFYNCTKAAANPDWAMVELTCLDATNAYVRAGVRHDATGAYAGYALEGCDAIVVPVVSSAGSANASNYEQLIQDGFLLTWDPVTDPI
ncbi:uncharacterized protein [Triticum aestivum]|uniref:uncharacterized protein n=1 Tax=Triticum aestivum TaxID=4565 RepID=UPI000DF51052|nr:uncharacterized protein LOC123076951 [Triticum aestivum]